MKLRKNITISALAFLFVYSVGAAAEETFCQSLQRSLPGMHEIGIDAFAITKGKEGKCEDYSEEEWKKMFDELKDAGTFIGAKYALPDTYSRIVQTAKGKVRANGKGMSVEEIQSLAVKMATEAGTKNN